MRVITKGLSYQKSERTFRDNSQDVHVTRYRQSENKDLTLLLSKVSEAINPNRAGNHIGEGANMDTFLTKQNGVRFIINGGFSHYRKNFYDWKHQDFEVGDPVGLVKIREHYFEDYVNLEQFGFFVQKTKQDLWSILQKDDISTKEKYILGCTPLLIYRGKKIFLPKELMLPVDHGKINPPSILGHGLQNHPRTAVGIKGDEIYFIIVEGKDNGGCTLLDLQDIGIELGLDSLLNLDGGGSTQFRLINNGEIIKSYVSEEDYSRILGHVLVIFDESLKI